MFGEEPDIMAPIIRLRHPASLGIVGVIHDLKCLDDTSGVAWRCPFFREKANMGIDMFQLRRFGMADGERIMILSPPS